jgi:hypothetical protein
VVAHTKKVNLETINFLLPHAFKFFFLSDLSLKKRPKTFYILFDALSFKEIFFLYPKKTRNKNKQIKHRSQFKIASKKNIATWDSEFQSDVQMLKPKEVRKPKK